MIARVDIGIEGMQSNGFCFMAVTSADGRYVAFGSAATNLVFAETNGIDQQIFVRDRWSGVTELVSVGPTGVPGNQSSQWPSISADGRFVAFYSDANNLVAEDKNGSSDVFVRDRVSGTTEIVSVNRAGVYGNNWSGQPAISPDGRYVAFISSADNLAPGAVDFSFKVYVHDRATKETKLESITDDGVQSNGNCYFCAISVDARFVAFSSEATNLVPDDTNEDQDVFVRDNLLATVERVSVSTTGAQGLGGSGPPSISSDGRYVAFRSCAPNLVPDDTNESCDTFVRDRLLGTTERVDLGPGGIEADRGGDQGSISADGRFVLFTSASSNLVARDMNPMNGVYLRDRALARTRRIDRPFAGGPSNGVSFVLAVGAISPDGRFGAFMSKASNLAPADTNNLEDAFLWDALDGSGFTSLCDPDAAGVASCPCANPPAGPGSGCDNSAATGGAVLAASGGAILSSDTLVFMASREPADALSVLFQGGRLVASGAAFGHGVRCAGEPLGRLFTRRAAGGIATFPDFQRGDPPISGRSAATVDRILPGQSRWYFVAYRDPAVLGGCAASSTFNATQTGRIDWGP